MQIKNSSVRYGAVAQLLHWTIVALIVTQFVLAERAELAEEAGHKVQQANILITHKSIGMTIFMLAVVRLIWRLANRVPAPVPTSRWQERAASIVHWALYVLILLTPMAGWFMSSARNFPVSWFGLFTFPDFVKPNPELYETLRHRHEVLASAIFVLALIHLLAALKHHFIDKDNVLRRMLPLKLR